METKNPNKFIEASSKNKRIRDAIDAIFATLPNNIRDMRRMIGFGFFISYGKVDTIPCAAVAVAQKPLDANLVLCLISVAQLSDREVVQRIVEVARTSEQYRCAIQGASGEPEVLPLQLAFLPAKLQLAETREGIETTEYIYNLVPISSEANIAAYVALIPNYAVVPIDTSQLEEVISTVIRN
jgi:hypothetical protein